MGREERGGEKGGSGWKKGRRQQLQYLLLYPRERLRYICLLKAPAQTGTEADNYKDPHVSPNSVRVLFKQTKNGLFQLHPGSMKRVKRCCTSLWELQKEKGMRGKKREKKAVRYCRFRTLHRRQ